MSGWSARALRRLATVAMAVAWSSPHVLSRLGNASPPVATVEHPIDAAAAAAQPRAEPPSGVVPRLPQLPNGEWLALHRVRVPRN